MENTKNWYDKSYKLIFLIPFVILLVCLIYLFSFYNSHGDIMYRDVSLSGGTTITLTDSISPTLLQEQLKPLIPDVKVREISDLTSNKQLALIIESSMNSDDLIPIIEEFLGYKLTEENSSVEFTGSTLSSGFYKQLMIAIFVSFILMSIVIFILFKSFIPSSAVIFAAFSNLVISLSVVNYFEVHLSAAGIAAFLMLIGYSVDTDILLTSRVIKSSGGTVNSRIYGAFKTGLFMTITAILAVLPAFFLVTGLPDSFRQIFLILAIGLFADIINTWLTNASIIKWYAVRKGMQ